MSNLNPAAAPGRTESPIQIDAENAKLEAQQAVTDKLTQLTGFMQDHFIDGGKLGVSFAITATRIAQGFAQANSEALKGVLPDMQKHIAGLPTALRCAILSGGSEDTRAILRTQLSDLAQDASLAARTGALWGITGAAYVVLPFTVSIGYIAGAALGAERANKLINKAMDNMNAAEGTFPEPTPAHDEAIDG